MISVIRETAQIRLPVDSKYQTLECKAYSLISTPPLGTNLRQIKQKEWSTQLVEM